MLYHVVSIKFDFEPIKEKVLPLLVANLKNNNINISCFQVAFFWEGNDPENEGKITYAELHVEVCKFANVLRDKGVQKVTTNHRFSTFFTCVPLGNFATFTVPLCYKFS